VGRKYRGVGRADALRFSNGEEGLIALASIDLNQTVLLNRECKVDFVLQSPDTVEQ
jgi:hypothetical protein